MKPIPPSLEPQSLMKHMRVLCKEIPRRQPTREGERNAAEYVVSTLNKMGLSNPAVETFKGIPTLGLPAILTSSMCLAALPIGAFCGSVGKVFAGFVLFFAAITFFQLLSCRPTLFRKIVERWDSQNVVKTIPARGKSKGHIYLIGHLDANKQRFIFPPPWPVLMKVMETSIVDLPRFGGQIWSLNFGDGRLSRTQLGKRIRGTSGVG